MTSHTIRILGIFFTLGCLLGACSSEYQPPKSPCVSTERDCDFVPIG